MPASTSSRTARSRCLGCALPRASAPQTSSSTQGTLTQTLQSVRADRSTSTSLSRTIIGPLVTMLVGFRNSQQRSTRQLIGSLNPLIPVRGRSYCDELTGPRRLSQLPPQYLNEVRLNQNH